jgi:hypothetical protein
MESFMNDLRRNTVVSDGQAITGNMKPAMALK